MPKSAGTATPPPKPDVAADEFVQHDDAVIGRAIRWSLVALVLIAGGGGIAYYVTHRASPPPPTRMTSISPPTRPVHAEAAIPQAAFTDVTADAGITFVHNNGAYGDKLLPETMGAGAAFFDYDGDGRPDLLLVNATYWPDHAAGKKPTTAALYHNEGNGKFRDATAGSGLDVPLYGMGVAIGDYDNDGKPDVFLTGVGGYRLFHNDGNGKFADVTAAAGVAGAAEDWGTGATFVDYDNDGKLDLFVCNYIRWSPEIDRKVGYSLTGIGRAYGPPTNFEGAFCRLYHIDGNGRFTDASEKAGVRMKNSTALASPVGKSLGVTPVDLDNDGWTDLVVANDTVQNFVFHNEKNGTFKEVGVSTGIAFDGY